MRARRAFLRAVCAGVRCWLRAVCAVLAAAFAAGCGRSCGCGRRVRRAAASAAGCGRSCGCGRVAPACGGRSCGSAPSRVVCALFAPAVAVPAVRILRAVPGMEHGRTRRARDGSRRSRGRGGVVDGRAASGGVVPARRSAFLRRFAQVVRGCRTRGARVRVRRAFAPTQAGRGACGCRWWADAHAEGGGGQPRLSTAGRAVRSCACLAGRDVRGKPRFVARISTYAPIS